MSAPLRLGLVGVGPWGRRYVETIRTIPGLKLVRAASRNPETPAIVGPDCAVAPDWKTVVEAADVDAVIVATPPALHLEPARGAVAARKPVLIEKPLTLSAPEALDFIASVFRASALVRVDNLYLHHAAYEELKRRGASLGQLRRLRCESGSWGPFRPGVPPLWDYGPHDAYMALDLIGKPAGVSARRVASRPAKDGGGEVVHVDVKFVTGASAVLETGNLVRPKRRRVEAVFERGTLVFDDLAADQLVLHPAAGAPKAVPVAAEKPLTRAVRAFADAVRSDDRSMRSLELGTATVELLAAAEASLKR